MNPKYKIGDLIYIANPQGTQEWETCPCCFGQLFVKITLGNGEEVFPICQVCKPDITGESAGKIPSKTYRPAANSQVIHNIDQAGDSFRYNYTEESRIFTDRESALVASEKMLEDARTAEEKRVKFLKDDACKSWSWHVGYHRRKIKDCQKDLEYHRMKMEYSKVASKVPTGLK